MDTAPFASPMYGWFVSMAEWVGGAARKLIVIRHEADLPGRKPLIFNVLGVNRLSRSRKFARRVNSSE